MRHRGAPFEGCHRHDHNGRPRQQRRTRRDRYIADNVAFPLFPLPFEGSSSNLRVLCAGAMLRGQENRSDRIRICGEAGVTYVRTYRMLVPRIKVPTHTVHSNRPESRRDFSRAIPWLLSASAVLVAIIQAVVGVRLAGEKAAYDGSFAVSALVQFKTALSGGAFPPRWTTTAITDLDLPFLLLFAWSPFYFCST